MKSPRMQLGLRIAGLALVLSSGLMGQVLSNSDATIRNSLCVGFDCASNPSFGFTTLRLEENNTRFYFEDTSSTASFPQRDWVIEANSSSNGGSNHLAILDCGTGGNGEAEDCNTGRPFTIEGGADSHSIYVDDGGRVGHGTSTPVVELHVKDGNTPTLRLEQDTSSGFAAQTWDLAGNETSFFVRDATNGSTLPFRIRPGAASNSLVIDPEDDVGVGILSPTSPLHVLRNTSGEVQMLDLENSNASGETSFRLSTGQGDWKVNTTNGATVLQFSKVGTGVGEMRLSDAGFLEITGGLVTTQGGGACTSVDPCDAVFAPQFHLESIEEHAEFMWENSHLKGVGPTNENGPINITQKTGGLINELEKAHIYIERLNERLKTKEEELGQLKQQVSEINSLKERLARLESLLAKAGSGD